MTADQPEHAQLEHAQALHAGPQYAGPTTVCTRCAEIVPAGAFCGCCGAALDGPAPRFPGMRFRSYVVAPAQRVLAPVISSTLFPQLPREYRNPFRIALAIMFCAVVALSVLRWGGPLVVLVALGIPSLFVLYLWESDAIRDIPARALASAAGLGIGFGVAWVWVTGGLVARSYGVPMAAGLVLENLFNVGLAIALGGVVFMVLPAVVVRIMMRPRAIDGESLDGFIIGALGALSFTAAATTTRLAPQFVSGLLDDLRPLRRLIEAFLYGIAAPLTAAAVGGLIGMLLWFRPGSRAAERRGLVRAVLVLFTLVVAVIYLAIWVIDASPLPRWPQLFLHLLVTLIALLAARLCVQLALLHEAPDPPSAQPVLCLNCEHVVPATPFCPACGFGSRGLSRSTRRQRTRSRPIRHDPATSADV